jgi:hypothetical protein
MAPYSCVMRLPQAADEHVKTLFWPPIDLLPIRQCHQIKPFLVKQGFPWT